MRQIEADRPSGSPRAQYQGGLTGHLDAYPPYEIEMNFADDTVYSIVATAADPREVERILIEAADNEPLVSTYKQPVVRFVEYGDSSLNFVLLIWIDVRAVARRKVRSALYFAIFHAISSFCNAGFSLYSQSFVDFRGDLLVNLTVGSLVIFGGVGFLVLLELKRRLFRSGQAGRASAGWSHPEGGVDTTLPEPPCKSV